MVILSSVLLVAAILCALIYSKNNKEQTKYPKPTDLMYINDYTGIIDDNAKSRIVSLGKELQDKTSAQVVAVVIKSLNGENIDKYANGLFNQWGIGQKDTNNGLLIVISIDDRKWRVEIGSGLEKVISNKNSSDVMNDVANTYFKDSLYGEGLGKAYLTFTQDIASHYGVRLDSIGNIQYDYNSKGSSASRSISGKGILTAIFIIMVVILIFRRKGPGGHYHNSGGHGWYNSSGDSNSWSNSSYDGSSGDSGGFGGGSSDGGGSSGGW